MAIGSEFASAQHPPHEQTAEEFLSLAGVDLDTGLTSRQVMERQQKYGLNILRPPVRVPAWRRLLSQFQDPQVYLLLSATAVAIVVWALEQESGVPYDPLIILAIVILNASIGFVQEDRAERALAALQKMVSAHATVIRNGQQQRLLARDLVPGDLLLLEEGDSIPADGRLVVSHSLITAESSLTGESLPVHKNTGRAARDSAIGDRANMVFAGTTAIAGKGRAVVTATGIETEFGRVSELLGSAEDQLAPLQRQLQTLGRNIGVAVVLIAVFVVGVLLAINAVTSPAGIMNVLLFGVALAVAATPEGLAAAITLVLAIGMRRIALRGAIVKKLPAVETLGSTTVIASDKTGTMTRNEMAVRSLITASGVVEVTGTDYSPEGSLESPQDGDLSAEHWNEIRRLLVAGTLVNNARLDKTEGGWKIQGDPTEAALLTVAHKGGILPAEMRSVYPRIAEVVFSSERKMMSTVHEDRQSPGERIVFTKGAPDILLASCTHEFVNGNSRPLTPERRDEILRTTGSLAVRALRTLGIATRTIPPLEEFDPDSPDERTIERDLTFLGLMGMMDPPRLEAIAAVALAGRAGIRTILITGDHPGTAIAVARELNIVPYDVVLSGAQLESMSDADLVQAVQSTGVYARVKPLHKFRIVRALQQNGEIVAMTGDGVNDAPALKAADIGIAMGITGTDVSKEAADLVLTDDNFSTIIAAVEEGRVIYDNIRKFLRYLLATNLGEVLTIFASALILSMRGGRAPHSLVLPLTAAQILWINLVTDGAPALALGVDTPAPDIMQRPPRPSNENIVDRSMFLNLLIVAGVMTIGTLSIFFLLEGSSSIEHRRSMAFTVLILFQLFNALNSRSETASAFNGIFANRWLWGAILLALALQIALLYVPALEKVFDVVPLSQTDWIICTSIASSVLWIREATKYASRIKRRQPTRV